MSDDKKTAGGRATEAGMAFQAAVTAWFSAQFLSDMPIGSQFGMPGTLRIVGLQCETGDDLDDVVVRLESGGAIYAQCKTRPSLDKSPDSLLGKTLEQLVRLYRRHGQRVLDGPPIVALLAVAEDAPRSLDTLEDACRMFDQGGAWDTVVAQVPEVKREALALFDAHARSAWGTVASEPLTGDDLVTLARLFRIRRFAQDSSCAEWRNASQLLGRRLYGGDNAGEAPMTALLGVSRKAIRTGAPMDRDGLLRALRAEGHVDVSSPRYDQDIAALVAYSNNEQTRLRKHTCLPLGEGIPIRRTCLDPLLAAAEGGSLLVTGEPGAGKSGVLLILAQRLSSLRKPVLFLSVEQFSGFNKQADFRAELRIQHDLIEVLAAWPGSEPCVLIVDALDASRGGPSESVIATFIADAVEKLGARWSVVASIRSFDLRNGRRFRDIMRGPPPDGSFVEEDMADVRHFRVPRLSSAEVAEVSAASPSLGGLESTAPQKLKDLLRNIFNLSLAAELLDAGVAPQSIQAVTTQSELIERYEDIRLPGLAQQRAVKATVTLMVQRRQLTVRAVDIESDGVEDVRRAGVLVSAGDRIAFAHHVLFDHIAGRFFLRWEDTNALREQLSGNSSLGLLLGPALRFALERVWREDGVGRPATWRFLADLAAASKPDPVLVSIALRTAAERVDVATDVNGLHAMISGMQDVRLIGRLLSQVARFVDMATTDRGLANPAALAWAALARASAAGGDLYLVDAARILLMTLAEKADLSDTGILAAFGEAARNLLQSAWSLRPESQSLATAGIRFVTRSYGSNPGASRELLERILDDRFEGHAPQEAPWLAEGVRFIIPHDAVFVARIYTILFTRDVVDEGTTWIGGSASRILPMTSTRRQDYQHARWRLNQALKAFLETEAVGGTAAVVGAVAGMNAQKRRSHQERQAATALEVSDRSVQVIDDHLSLQDWRETSSHEEKPLTVFVEFLRVCRPDVFRVVVETVLALPTNAAVWARILGVAADRPSVADDLLWPLVSNPRFVALQGIARDAIIYIASVYGMQSADSRIAFEYSALAEGIFSEPQQARWWRSVLARLLSSIPPEHLATPQMQALRAELERAGDLAGNPPFMSITTAWGSDENIVDSMLRSGGANLERSPDREIRTASRIVEDQIKLGSDEVDAGVLATLWGNIVLLVDALDVNTEAEPHPDLVHSSWGAVCNGVERLAKSSAYAPGTGGLPGLDSLLAIIDRLSASPYPESTEAESGTMAWGNWDVRVYAASSLVALAPRFAVERPDIVDRMRAVLKDPAPTVRLQVAQALNVLWNVAPDQMWSLVMEVVESETHDGVLQFFMGGPMGRLSRKYPERCAGLLSRILDRGWARHTAEEANRDSYAEACADLVTFLYVGRDQPEAWAWIERWTEDLPRGVSYLTSMLHDLRQVFFFPYREAPKPDELAVANRARHVLDVLLRAAVASVTTARPHLLGAPDEAAISKWRPSYLAAHRVVEQVCDQLYFGSGAFRSQGDSASDIGLGSASTKKRFVKEYAGVLDAVAMHAQARTVHNLIELLSYLVEGNPGDVFDRMAGILLGSGADDGYQFESMGLDSVVKLVRRYLADHRDIFEDPNRRRKLVDVLELFSSVGWPDALKLLFELPDLLR